MKFTATLSAALAVGAVKALWVETCSTTKGCDVAADRSMYTTPTLWFNSSGLNDDVTTNGTTVIYGNNDVDGPVLPYPPGFKMTSDCVTFTCLTGEGNIVVSDLERVDSCDKGFLARVDFPSCYNGKAMEDDNSHVAFPVDGHCPQDHSLQLVDLAIQLSYPIVNRGAGNYFFTGLDGTLDTTGSLVTAAFVANWSTAAVHEAAVDECAAINDTISNCAPLVDSNMLAGKGELKDRSVFKANACTTSTSAQGANPTTFVTSASSTVAAEVTAAAVERAQSQTPKIKSLVNTYVYNGCWLEGKNGFALDGEQWTDVNGLTVESCVDHCLNLGFGVAGLQFGSVCFCGAELTNGASLVPDVQCGLACAGNKREVCGGEGRLTTYKSG